MLHSHIRYMSGRTILMSQINNKKKNFLLWSHPKIWPGLNSFTTTLGLENFLRKDFFCKIVVHYLLEIVPIIKNSLNEQCQREIIDYPSPLYPVAHYHSLSVCHLLSFSYRNTNIIKNCFTQIINTNLAL